MDLDQTLIMLLVCVAAYMAGYASLAMGLAVLVVLISVFSGATAKKPGPAAAGGVSVSGAEMLEPIIVRTTKGAPFRIPEQMSMRVQPNWHPHFWNEPPSYAMASLFRMGYRALGRSEYE